jgi:gas vesicle protein
MIETIDMKARSVLVGGLLGGALGVALLWAAGSGAALLVFRSA